MIAKAPIFDQEEQRMLKEKMKAHTIAQKPQSLRKKKINFNLRLQKTQNGTRKVWKNMKNKTLGYCFYSSDQRKRGEKNFWSNVLGCKVHLDSLCQQLG